MCKECFDRFGEEPPEEFHDEIHAFMKNGIPELTQEELEWAQEVAKELAASESILNENFNEHTKARKFTRK